MQSGSTRLFVFSRYIHYSVILDTHFHKLDFLVEDEVEFVSVLCKFILVTRNVECNIRHAIAYVLSQIRNNSNISIGSFKETMFNEIDKLGLSHCFARLTFDRRRGSS